jgi:hypothetical protein
VKSQHMKATNILIVFLKLIAIIVFTLGATFIMAKLFPPPKGTAFDGLEYVLKPIYLSLFSGCIYLLHSFYKIKNEKIFFISALLLNLGYVVLLFLRIL